MNLHVTPGAVNTVLFKNGRAEGFNLDVAGVAYSLKKLQYGEGARRAVVLGTGGAARAVVAALMLYKTREIVILNRREERAASLRDFLQSRRQDSPSVQGVLTGRQRDSTSRRPSYSSTPHR